MKRAPLLKLLPTLLLSLLLAAGVAFAQQRSVKIGVYGGYFQDSFDEFIFPLFSADTGIAVESISEPTGEAWLVQLETAARAGQAPADVSMIAQGPLLRGVNSGLWQAYDESAMPNLEYMRPQLLSYDQGGNLVGVGAVSWYITLVTNTDVFPEAPTSWAELWGDHPNQVGLLALPINSFLLEITATTFFGGTGILDTEEGILQVRRHRPRHRRRLPGALHLPEGGRRARLGLLGGQPRLEEDRRSPGVHQLGHAAPRTRPHRPQGRHGAYHRARVPGFERRRVRFGFQ